MKIFKVNFGNRKNRVVIDGREFNAGSVSVDGDGTVYVDDEKTTGNLVGPVSVTIHGDVQTLENVSGDVEVAGSVGSVTTQSGDVWCSDVSGNVTTKSGDVECDVIGGNVTTMSGDVIVV